MDTKANSTVQDRAAVVPKRKRCQYCKTLHNEEGAFCSRRCLKADDNLGPN
jgi:hypothetical protein